MSQCYTFTTIEAAAAALVAAENEIRAVAAERGFTVLPDGGIVGKFADTGLDNPASVTRKWSDVLQFSDGTWGFPSLRVQFPTTWSRIESAAILPSPRDVKIMETP